MFNAGSLQAGDERLGMIRFAILHASIKQFCKAEATRFRNRQRLPLRLLIVALLAAAPLAAPRTQQAQDDCTPTQAPGCYTQPKRDIAFLIDASGSVEQRGQT